MVGLGLGGWDVRLVGRLACVQASNELRLVARVNGALAAGLNKFRGVANRLTGFKVLQALGQLRFKGMQPSSLGPNFFEFLAINFTNLSHGPRRRCSILPAGKNFLDLAQGHPDVVELVDPPNAIDGIVGVETVAAFGASGGAKKPQLLVMMNGSNGLARGLGQVAHTQQLACPGRQFRRFADNGEVADGFVHRAC